VAYVVGIHFYRLVYQTPAPSLPNKPNQGGVMGQNMREYRVSPAKMMEIETLLRKHGFKFEVKKHMGVMYIFFDAASDLKKADKTIAEANL